MSVLAKIQAWFESQCDGEWEHQQGISIQSCDNPGWWVKIDLSGTALKMKKFAPIVRGDLSDVNPEPPWLRCYVEDGVYIGAGDPTTLEEILEIFIDWTE